MSYRDNNENDENLDVQDNISAIEIDPNDPYRKVKEEARKEYLLQTCSANILETRPANRWINRNAGSDEGELLGSLWRSGEVALLLGATGIGKSIFATHIAETLARGRTFEPFEAPAPRRVLYVDFRRTVDQFTQRYTCPRTAIGKHRVRYRFSGRLKRASFSDDLCIPSVFNGDFEKYFRHSLRLTFNGSGAEIIIIDDLSYIAMPTTDISHLIRRMRDLRIMAAETGRSVLAIYSVSQSVGKNSLKRSLSIPHSVHRICDLADSVFTIGSSTFGLEFRYVKHLKSSVLSPLIAHPSSPDANVLTYRLERSAGMQAMPRSAKTSLAKPSTNSSLITNNSSLNNHNSPPTPSPFIGFTYLGPSPESDHHRDYQAEAVQAQLAHTRELKRLQKRSTKEILADAVIDGSYAKYLES